MRHIDSFTGITDGLVPFGGSVVTIGVFDGLHRGHLELISRTVARAHTDGLASLVVSFTEHPLRTLAPPYCPRRLLYPDRRRQLLAGAGVDVLAEVEFSEDFSRQAPDRFVEDTLVGLCRMKAIVCGYDFSFGRAGAGSTALLHEMGARFGFAVEVLPPVSDGETFVKSTMIRDLLYSGDVTRAAAMLTRPYELRGVVTDGFGRGRELGFPTANLKADERHLVPARGVYLCAARVAGDPRIRPAMTNIGMNPTFGGSSMSIESHLIDHHDDLLGRDVSLFFLARLRDERKFSGPEALVAQLHDDLRVSRELIAGAAVREQLDALGFLTRNDP